MMVWFLNLRYLAGEGGGEEGCCGVNYIYKLMAKKNT